jgi:hypothetical protein
VIIEKKTDKDWPQKRAKNKKPRSFPSGVCVGIGAAQPPPKQQAAPLTP